MIIHAFPGFAIVSFLLPTAQSGFILLTVIYLVLLIRTLYKGIQHTQWDAARRKRSLIVITGSLLVWMIFVSLWSATGVMSDFSLFPFNFMPVIAIPLLSVVALVIFSKGLSEILIQIPAESLVRLQGFRFFVELLLWALFVAGVVPEQMTFEGRNFDILAGITAPVVAWMMVRRGISTPWLVLWNVACLALLINIVTVAILSTPTPWRVFMNDPANTIVAHFPVSWLPGFLVPLAYTLHFLSLKQLWIRRNTARSVAINQQPVASTH